MGFHEHDPIFEKIAMLAMVDLNPSLHEDNEDS
jgi:hypothetical protein